MIRPLLIGEPESVRYYSELVKQSAYFEQAVSIGYSGNAEEIVASCFEKKADAILLAGRNTNFFEIVSSVIRCGIAVYFTDLPELSSLAWNSLGKLVKESGVVVFPELKGMYHPVLEEFLTPQTGHLSIGFRQNCPNKQAIPQLLTEAFSMVSVLSPMPVRKMNIHSDQGKKLVVDFALLDHSEGRIEVFIDREPLLRIQLDRANRTYYFDLVEGYVENHFGNRFPSQPWDNRIMSLISLEKFALSVITKNNQAFDFDRYLLVCSLIQKLDLFLSL